MTIRKVLGTAVALCLLATGALVAPGAASAATSGTEWITITFTGNHEGAVAHGGVFTGGGKLTEHDAYDVLHVSGGTIRVNHPYSQEHYRIKLNHRTCYAKIKDTGRYTLSNGTGRLAGITGHGTYHGTFKANLPRKKNGRCNKNADAYGVGVLHAHGPASRA